MFIKNFYTFGIVLLVGVGSLSAASKKEGVTYKGKPKAMLKLRDLERRSHVRVKNSKTNFYKREQARPQNLLRNIRRQDGVKGLKFESYGSSKHGIPKLPSFCFNKKTSGVNVNFTAVTLKETNAFPPDSMGAAGPKQFLMCVNDSIKVFSKHGKLESVLNTTTDEFFEWGGVLQPGFFTTDPRVFYDRFSTYWFILMNSINEEGTVANLLLAVLINDTKPGVIDKNTTIQFYSIGSRGGAPNSSSLVADFPTLGVDAISMYVGVNLFDQNGNYVTSDGIVINKGGFTGETPSLASTSFHDLVDPVTLIGPLSPQGVTNFDTGIFNPIFNGDNGYFIGVDNNSFGRLILRIVTFDGNKYKISDNIPITVLTTALPLDVPHKGNKNGKKGQLSGIDDRLCDAHVRDGLLYTSHNLGVNDKGQSSPNLELTRDGSRWYEIDLNALNPTNPFLLQAGTLFDKSANNPLNYWIPSVITNGPHSLLLGCSTAGNESFINANLAMRFYSDLPGTLRKSCRFTNSKTAYNPPGDPGSNLGRRWGDYSHSSVDPVDDMTMWSIQEFCNADNSYGCRVVRVLAPPPPKITGVFITDLNDMPLPAIPLTGGPVKVKILGDQTSGKGFYNPNNGSGVLRQMIIKIGDYKIPNDQIIEVKQTSVEFVVDALQNLDVGKHSIKIKNPNGKSVSKNKALKVVP